MAVEERFDKWTLAGFFVLSFFTITLLAYMTLIGLAVEQIAMFVFLALLFQISYLGIIWGIDKVRRKK